MMIDQEEWSTIRSLSMLRTTILSASVCPPTKLRSGCQHGLQRPKRTLRSLNLGSQIQDTTKFLLDLAPSLIGTSPTTIPELSSELVLHTFWSENCQSRTSTLDVVSSTSTCSASCKMEPEEEWPQLDQFSSTTTNGSTELFWTTQTSSGWTCQESCQRVHQFQMPIESGDIDRTQCSISTIELATDIDTESLVTFHGMDLWTSQLCHTSTTQALTLSTEPSRETSLLPHNADDRSYIHFI